SARLPAALPLAALTQIATFDQPVAMSWFRGTPFVAEKTGRVRRLSDGNVAVDLSAQVSLGSEQGLLGLAFTNDFMYMDYTDLAGDTRLIEYAFDGTSATSARQVLFVDQPFDNHNG